MSSGSVAAPQLVGCALSVFGAFVLSFSSGPLPGARLGATASFSRRVNELVALYPNG